ncbi:MAG: hypothetical protein D6694_13270 [Gammaproteobacteria bacterium]|nr:MAG: hypothetical protein D6694_13270 [Gammaproteobacteria bacterium]
MLNKSLGRTSKNVPALPAYDVSYDDQPLYEASFVAEAIYNPKDGAEAFIVPGNPDTVFFMGGWRSGPRDDSIYISIDTGRTWTFVRRAEWSPRHTFGFEKLGRYYYVFGADGQDPKSDCWRSTDLRNWTLMNDTISLMADRILYGNAAHDGWLYMIGGQDTTAGNNITVYTDVLRSRDGATWERVCNNCVPAIGNLGGAVESYNGRLWIVGGELYDDTNGHIRYKSVYSSKDGGRTWHQHPDLPIPFVLSYPKVFVFDGKLWVYGGYDDSQTNTSVLMYTYDGDTWFKVDHQNILPPTHAAAVAVGNDYFVIPSGNIFNEVYKVEKK